MGRIAQPLEIAKLKGAERKHPERYREHVPKSNLPLGEPPEYMAEDAKACWWELLAKCIPGTVTGADSMMLEVLANTFAAYRRNPDDYPSSKLTLLKSLFASFGLGPSERRSLGMDKPKEENPFAAIHRRQ